MGEKSELEKCVSCGKETHIPKDVPIDQRDCYIDGAGQACYGCWDDLYPERQIHVYDCFS